MNATLFIASTIDTSFYSYTYQFTKLYENELILLPVKLYLPPQFQVTREKESWYLRNESEKLAHQIKREKLEIIFFPPSPYLDIGLELRGRRIWVTEERDEEKGLKKSPTYEEKTRGRTRGKKICLFFSKSDL